jgi:hypothetical protein
MNFSLTCLEGWISDSHRITVSLFTPKIIPTCLLLTEFNEQYLFTAAIKSREYIPTSVLFLKLPHITPLRYRYLQPLMPQPIAPLRLRTWCHQSTTVQSVQVSFLMSFGNCTHWTSTCVAECMCRYWVLTTGCQQVPVIQLYTDYIEHGSRQFQSRCVYKPCWARLMNRNASENVTITWQRWCSRWQPREKQLLTPWPYSWALSNLL